MSEQKFTIIRWVKGTPVQAVILPAAEAFKTKREWRKLPGDVAFKAFRPEDQQIVAVANEQQVPLQPRY